MYSFDGVKQILETSIDSLVDNFIREPYIHRCEHSLHCELYTMLISHRALQGLYPIGKSPYKASLVHKEWPEPSIRGGKNKRGNVDLAILNIDDLATAVDGINSFTEGRIRPDFIVEIGLNYRIEHLENDNSKLENSGYKSGNEKKAAYLVHLWQPHKGIKDKSIELQNLNAFISTAGVEVAVVVFTDSHIWVKHLSEKVITEIPIGR
ncbi:MAG TPA: hypothetical protein PKZ64_17170 [Spirochaetota bacterium]|nr:hypothetical protein [Spirochaetota bacterium]